jgi:hypothetical protein
MNIRKECEDFINDRPSLVYALKEPEYVEALTQGLCEFIEKIASSLPSDAIEFFDWMADQYFSPPESTAEAYDLFKKQKEWK